MQKLKKISDSQVIDEMSSTTRALYFYLLIGGILSPVYFWGAVMKSDLLHFLTSPAGLGNLSFSLGVVGRLLVNAMLRVLAWAPDYVSSVIFGAQTTHEWLWGVKAVAVSAF